VFGGMSTRYAAAVTFGMRLRSAFVRAVKIRCVVRVNSGEAREIRGTPADRSCEVVQRSNTTRSPVSVKCALTGNWTQPSHSVSAHVVRWVVAGNLLKWVKA
jgi:hypothetical protein